MVKKVGSGLRESARIHDHATYCLPSFTIPVAPLPGVRVHLHKVDCTVGEPTRLHQALVAVQGVLSGLRPGLNHCLELQRSWVRSLIFSQKNQYIVIDLNHL